MSAPSARAEELARQFEQLNDEVITFVEACDKGAWKAQCAEDERSIGAVAQHVADGYRAGSRWVRTIAAGQPITITMDDIHTANAQAAAAIANRSQSEVADALRQSGAKAASTIRELNDEDLARSAPFGPAGGSPASAEAIITGVMLRHPRAHLDSMRKGAASQSA
jgi:uncharacterized damage-inducible protein DinB